MKQSLLLAITISLFISAFPFFGCKKSSTPTSNNNNNPPEIKTLVASNYDSLAKTINLNGEVISEGSSAVTKRGFCYSFKDAPNVSDSVIESGFGKGSFSKILSNILPDVTYHIRAFGVNSFGTTYGNEILFSVQPNFPIVTTGIVNQISDSGVNCSGNVSETGGSSIVERGFVYDTIPNPNYQTSKKVIFGNGLGKYNGFVKCYNGKKYYLKAFAKNSSRIGYGQEINFTTLLPISEINLIVNNGKNSEQVSLSIDSIKISVLANAIPPNLKIASLEISRNITGQSTITVFSKPYSNISNINEIYFDKIFQQVSIDDGDIITYNIKVTDNNGAFITKTISYTVSSITTSNQILIGVQNNSVNDYHFFGITNEFKRYRSGLTGIDLAKDNSNKIDFLFYYNTSGGNTIYSPNFPFASGVAWGPEVATWPTKNTTKFKLTSINASEFDSYTGSTFMNEINFIDFSAGTSNRLNNLVVNQVFAFQNNEGKRGFVLVSNIAAGASGTIVIKVKVEN